MSTVFLSYSTKDHYFAELAAIKLAEANVILWRDRDQLRAGTEWRQGIERGISESLAVLVALSTNSSESSFVTFEWAYAIGKRKPIIPIKLNDCVVHPRLETVQYLDFSVPGALPWASLIERIREIETDLGSSSDELTAGIATEPVSSDEKLVVAILAYLNQRGYQMVSFDRVRRRIDGDLTDAKLTALIDSHPKVFRRATLAEGKAGIAKLVP